MNEILVLYYSRYGATEALAREVCRGVDSVQGMSARLRTVPPVSAACEASEESIPDSGPPYVSCEDLVECAGDARRIRRCYCRRRRVICKSHRRARVRPAATARRCIEYGFIAHRGSCRACE